MKTKQSWKSYLGAGALAVALLVVLNPEIRALLLLADAVGLEALFLMAIAQLRNYWPVVRVVVEPVVIALCKLSSGVGGLSIRALELIVPFRPLSILLGPVFIALSFGVWCPAKRADHIQLPAA